MALLDAFHTKGATHTECQDYTAISGNSVVVADGCSSSPQSDWGARILSQCYARTGSIYDALKKAKDTIEILDLPEDCLNATLLEAAYYHSLEAICVRMWGDGVVIARKRDTQKIQTIQREFTSGAPAYPAYIVNKRMGDYFKNYPGKDLRHYDIIEDEVLTSEYPIDGHTFDPFRVVFPVQEFDLVMISTDGLLSFQEGGNGRRTITLREAVANFTDFKSYAGVFVQKRCKAVLKRADHVTHYDDLGIGAIYVSDEELKDEGQESKDKSGSKSDAEQLPS